VKRYLLPLILFFLAWRLSADIGMEYTPREIIVKTSQPANIRGTNFSLPEFDTFLAGREIREIKRVTPSPENQYYVIRFEEELDWEDIKSQNLRFEGIEYIQPNYLNEFLVTPNDPLYPHQVLNLVKIPEAWHYETGNENVIVAIVDSGLWFEHPEFWCDETNFPKDNIWINHAEYPPDGQDNSGNGYVDDWRGWNFVDAPELSQIALGNYLEQDNDPTDETGHGTHIAGVIGADTNNGLGIAGICWNVKMMILRAGFRTTIGPGYLQDDDAAAAIIYAADNGAHIISISWGSDIYSQIIADACQYAYERGVIIVASAGNTPVPEIMYPAKLNTTIAVGAVNNALGLTGFTSYGPDLDIVAPGEFIMSTYIPQDDGSIYYQSSGTSMSTPFVVGGIALLMAREPGLSLHEVRSRLFSSAVDLGAPGFDNYFGHGLLNVERMLTSTNHPYIEITYPLDYAGLAESFPINGTVEAPDFFRYSVMFTNTELPTPLDWKDVTTHQNTPLFYYSPVNDDLIASFHVPPSMKDDYYLIRIKLETVTADIYEKRIRVNINQTPPSMKEGSPVATKRFREDIPYYFITSGFDQPVTIEMKVTSHTGANATLYSNYADSLHVLQIPGSFPEGNVSVQINAHNISGLEYSSPTFENVIYIDKAAIPTDTFNQSSVGTSLITTPKSFDFNGNGLIEFIGLAIDEEQMLGEVSIFEFDTDRLVSNYQFEDPFLPVDMGNTNNAGLEVLGLRGETGPVGDTAVIYDTFGGETYPNVAFWSKENVIGGNFVDYNNNGIEDLVLIRNYQNTRVLSLYSRTGSLEFTEEHTLFNMTETDQRNTFSPRVASKDLTGNGHMNLLAADTDGDIIVYEIYQPGESEMIWTTRLPVKNLYHLAIADFTGNGALEFCVGGYQSDYIDPHKTFWHFEFFRYQISPPGFVSLGYIAFDHYDEVNSIKAFDLDGDGSEELILSLTPYLYVIDFRDGLFKPVWQGSTYRTYNVVPIPETDSNSAGVIINNIDDNGDFKSQFVTASDFSGPPSPVGLITNPVDEQTVELTWNESAAEYYLIYRREGEGITLIDSTATNHYIDENLAEGVVYHYALRGRDYSYQPNLSQYSAWKEAIPYAIPEILSLEMTAVNELRILFNVQLSNEAINIGYYNVNNGIGRPASVNHTDNQRGLLLRFSTPITELLDDEYYLEIVGLRGRSGVPFPDGQYSFEYKEDLIAPYIVSHQLIDNKKLSILFSKFLDPGPANNPVNYMIDYPLVDRDNSVKSIIAYDDLIEIEFNKELKISNRAYYLMMQNIVDLAGNRLPNNENLIRFQLTEIDDLAGVQVIPNPYIKQKHRHLEFIGLPLEKQGEISIYSISGEQVYTSRIEPLTELNSSFLWHAVNNANRQLSSGIYFYVIRMGDRLKRGEIAIVN